MGAHNGPARYGGVQRMTKPDLYIFLQKHHHAVLATVSTANEPEAALVGIAVTESLELVFDTSRDSRKYANLIANPHVALVIGWDHEITVQYEGEAHLPSADQTTRYKQAYFNCFPKGRERESWPDTVYFVVKPNWLRYSDFSKEPPKIFEFGRGM